MSTSAIKREQVRTSDNELAQIEPFGVIKLKTNQGAMASAPALQISFDGGSDINLNYDGSANFGSGNISLNANGSQIWLDEPKDNPGAQMFTGGGNAPALFIRNDHATESQASAVAFRVLKDGTGNANVGLSIRNTGAVEIGDPTSPNISLNADGSGEFSGEVNMGNRNPGSTTSVGTRIAVDGTVAGVYTQALPSVGSSANAFQAHSGNNEIFKVAFDGSARFAGKVTVNNLDIDALTTLP